MDAPPVPPGDQLSSTLDASLGVIRHELRARPRPCFNLDLLHEFVDRTTWVASSEGTALARDGSTVSFDHVVCTSATPGVFSLGGDLALFADLAERGDRDVLDHYARTCVEIVHRTSTGHGIGMPTIALVQGAALGGGFEAALGCTTIVAERHATFGFPEIRFNLFPGMGAVSFLQRRAGPRVARDLLTTGRTCTAEEMHDLGLVDVLCAPGTGAAAVERLVRSRRRRGNGLQAIDRALHRVDPVPYDELVDVVDIWVDAVLALRPEDLRLMRRLAGRQSAIAAA